MRGYVVQSVVGHVVLLVGFGFLARSLYTPPPIASALEVGLVTPLEEPVVDEAPPPPPEEVERPERAPEPDPAPVESTEDLSDFEMPDPELPVPPAPREVERPVRDVAPDPIPEEIETPEETPDFDPPDSDLPPPPIEDLPDPERVQRVAERDTVTAPVDETPVEVTPPPPDMVVEELGQGRKVGADTEAEVDDAYLRRVRRTIGRLWQPTPASALGQPRVVTVVSFRIRADGSIENPTVSQSSQLSVFDREAQRAVFDASPLPKLPPRFGDGIAVNFRFEYVR